MSGIILSQLFRLAGNRTGAYLGNRMRVVHFSGFFPLLVSLLLVGCGDSSDRGYSASRSIEPLSAVFPHSHDLDRLAKIGPGACVHCHFEEVEAWKSSHHAKANRPVSKELDASAFTGIREVKESGVTYRMLQVEEEFKLRVIEPDGSTREYDIVGVIGETPIRQYLAKFPGNRFQTISASYDVINDRWIDVFADENRIPGEWGHWSGQGMNWNANCAECHMTEFKKNFDFEKNAYDSQWTQQGLACAECHTGLEEHVTAALVGDYKTGLTQLNREQIQQNCASCHSRRDQLTDSGFVPGHDYHDHFSLLLPDQPGLYHADGQILDEVFVYGSFELSRMRHAGVTCIDCHDPHSLKPILPVENNMLCMHCHRTGLMQAPVIEPVKHSFHPEGSTGNRCVNCHMSETVYMQTDFRADHGFHSPDPLMTREHGIPNACNKCHRDQTVDWAVKHAEEWYGEKLKDRRQRIRAGTISKAYRLDPTALSELIALAKDEAIPAWQATYAGLIANYLPDPESETYLRSLLKSPHALVRRRATQGLNRLERGHALLVEQLADSSRSVRISAGYGLTVQNQEVVDLRAAKEWADYLGLHSDRPQNLMILAQKAAHNSESDKVRELVHRAIRLDSMNPSIYEQCAILLSVARLNDEARSKLLQGWELAPKEPRFPYSLGLLAAEENDLERAVGYLEETVAMDPQFRRAWYNLALLYQRLNRPEDARKAMIKAQRP